MDPYELFAKITETLNKTEKSSFSETKISDDSLVEVIAAIDKRLKAIKLEKSGLSFIKNEFNEGK